MEQLTLQVEGMSCGHCVNAIESSVKELNGVEQVKVQLAEGTVEVTIDSSVVTLKDIVAVIEDQDTMFNNYFRYGNKSYFIGSTIYFANNYTS